MHYLIDGYNLLHVTDVFTNAVGPKSLPKLHSAFLDFLVQLLGDDAARTTVVFDAKGRHATSRRTSHYAGITVHYASKEEDADSLIDELLREHHSPRRLTVVSSDHQVQRAAKRRRAKAVDSEVWYADLRRRVATRPSTGADSSEKPSDEAAVQDANWWLAQFDAELLREMAEALKPPRVARKPRSKRHEEPQEEVQPQTESVSEQPPSKENVILDGSNPFPAEYIDEIVREIAEETSKPAKRKRR